MSAIFYFLYIRHESAQSPDITLFTGRICSNIWFGNNQGYFLSLHFIHLSFGNALLQGTQELCLPSKSVRLIENLSPTVFAGGLISYLSSKRNITITAKLHRRKCLKNFNYQTKPL